MNELNHPEVGLTALLADVVEGDLDPALLARYADDPSALHPKEREMVESRLASSPQYRDQLKVLQNFEIPATPSARISGSWIADAVSRVHDLFASRLVLTGVSTAVVVSVVAILVVFSRSQAPATVGRTDSIIRVAPSIDIDRPIEPASPVDTEGPNAILQVPLQVFMDWGIDPVPPSIDVDFIPSTRIYSALPELTELAVSMPEYRAPPETPPQFSGNLVERPAGVMLTMRASPPPPAPAVILQALAPSGHVGQTASEAASVYWYLEAGPLDWFFSENPGGGVFKIISMEIVDELRIEAERALEAVRTAFELERELAEAAARYSSGHPDLIEIERNLLEIEREFSGESPARRYDDLSSQLTAGWTERELPAPSRGLQGIRLSDFGIELDAGVNYRWEVSYPGLDANSTGGWIRRVELPRAELPLEVAEMRSEAIPGERAAIYADAGLWYDALSILLEYVSYIPSNESARAALLELLGQGGLEAVDEAVVETLQ